MQVEEMRQGIVIVLMDHLEMLLFCNCKKIIVHKLINWERICVNAACMMDWNELNCVRFKEMDLLRPEMLSAKSYNSTFSCQLPVCSAEQRQIKLSHLLR